MYTEGRHIAGLDEQFTFWGTGNVVGVPTPVIVLIVVALATYFLLTQTVFGLHVYAVGGGEETARLASVLSTRITFGVYVVSGLSNGLNLLEVPSYNQQVAKGLVFIIAVLPNFWLKRRWQTGTGSSIP